MQSNPDPQRLSTKAAVMKSAWHDGGEDCKFPTSRNFYIIQETEQVKTKSSSSL